MSALFCRAMVSGAALVLGATSLAACGSSRTLSSPQPSDKPLVTAACALSGPPASQDDVPDLESMGRASGKVGVILPDAARSATHAALLRTYLAEGGLTPDVQDAGGSAAHFVAIAERMIAGGVKVLILDPVDATSGVAVERLALRKGVQPVEYDQILRGGVARYAVAFDSEDIGRLQAQTLLACLSSQKVRNPRVVLLDGSTEADSDAVIVAKGAHEILDPLVENDKLTIVGEKAVPGGEVEAAAGVLQQMLTKAGRIQGVLAPTDDLANVVMGVLRQTGLNGHVVVTGQGADVQGLQNVIKGQQSMTIFKSAVVEAQAATALVIALLRDTSPAAAGLTMSPFADPRSPGRDLQALLLPAEVITQANLNDVTDSGALTVSQMCKGVESACASLGVS